MNNIHDIDDSPELFGPMDVTSDDGVVSATFDDVSEAVFNLLNELHGFKIWEYPDTAKFVLDILRTPRRWVLSLPNGEMNIVFVDTNKTFKLGEPNESARLLYFLNVAFKDMDSTLAGL